MSGFTKKIGNKINSIIKRNKFLNFIDTVIENTTYKLRLIQDTDQKNSSRKPMVIPILIGLLDINGKEILKDHLLTLTKNEQEFTFNNIMTKPILSILRDFSSPVIINRKTSNAENACLPPPPIARDRGRSTSVTKLPPMLRACVRGPDRRLLI